MITTGSSSGPSCTCGGLQASKFVPKLNKDQSGDGDVELNLMTMMMAMTMSLHFGRLASTLLYRIRLSAVGMMIKTKSQ